MVQEPWRQGPLELLNHGLEHLRAGSDFDYRIAMISIDNAIELMIKTYLGLPPRITGIRLTRTKREESNVSFPALLDALTEVAPDKVTMTNLGIIEWFHQLRNQLYHQGNGITVEKKHVESYAEIAKTLFELLFPR
ncbi:MAG: hypothetical protein IAG10_33210 [Planctomycetaceae bacterium]|nr:hypothetical protein [Planctomycetaceae bacterium]